MPIDFNYSGTEQSLAISEVDGLQGDLDAKANQSALDTEITDRTNGDNSLQGSINSLQLSVNTKAEQSALDDEETDRQNADSTLQSNIDLKQNLLNTSNLFLDTSVAGQPILGLGTATPSSAAGSDSFFQIYGATDCGISLKRGVNDWEWKNINPSGNLCLYASGSHKAEWSNTELLLKQGLTVKGAVVDLESLPSVAQTGTSKLWNNSGAINIGAGASGGGGSGVILEKFSNYTLGQSWVTSAGSITIPNVTTVQSLATVWTVLYQLTGSEITYQPPAGATRVEYEYSFYMSPTSSLGCAMETEFLIDGVIQTVTREMHPQATAGAGVYGQKRVHYKVIISIDGTTDASKCSLATWTSPKTIKVQGLNLCASGQSMYLHRLSQYFTYPTPGYAPVSVAVPILSITAY